MKGIESVAGKSVMANKAIKAIAYLRTSSAQNVGGDSDKRQRTAISVFARHGGYRIVDEYYDAAVSGADPVEDRPGFAAMLDRIESNGVRTVIVEDVSRLARDMTAGVLGIMLLKARGVTVVDASGNNLTNPADPMQKAMIQIGLVFAELEKSRLVGKLKAARDRKRIETGRCEGRKPVPAETVALARKLARKPKNKPRPSLRAIAAGLAERGHLGPTGKPYHAGSIKRMLEQV